MASQNVESIEGVYEAYARRDIVGLLGSRHEDFEIRASEPLPWGGSFKGTNGMLDAVGQRSSSCTGSRAPTTSRWGRR